MHTAIQVDILCSNIQGFSGKLLQEGYRASWRGILDLRLLIHSSVASYYQSYNFVRAMRTLLTSVRVHAPHDFPVVRVCADDYEEMPKCHVLHLDQGIIPNLSVLPLVLISVKRS